MINAHSLLALKGTLKNHKLRTIFETYSMKSEPVKLSSIEGNLTMKRENKFSKKDTTQ